jgi:protein-disulfide isomerase
MASRTRQKEEARARRLAEERAAAERAGKQRRIRMLGGVLVAAVVIVVVAVVVSSSGGTKAAPKPGSKQATQQATAVNSLLAGIPQSGNRLGNPKAHVVVTEFGDLECPICREFALTGENSLITNDVKTGKVQLVYKSLPTATLNGPDPNVFPTQQAAAYAAGLQNKAWYYIELFYHEQGQEDTAYVTPSYLSGLAQQVPGLDMAKWSSDRTSQTLLNQVTQDEELAKTLNFDSTPSFTVQGPGGEAQPLVGDQPYSNIQSEINSVS